MRIKQWGRRKKIGVASVAVVAALIAAFATQGALSLYSESHTTQSTLNAASWGIQMNGQTVNTTSPTIQLGDFSDVLPGDTFVTQVRFTNTGSASVVIKPDLTLSSATGDLAPYITYYGNGALDPTSAGAPDWMFPSRLAANDPDAAGPDGFNTIKLDSLTSAANTEAVTVAPGTTFAFNFYAQVSGTATAEELSALSVQITLGWNISQIDSGSNQYRQAPDVDPSLIPMH